jgi:arsenate reductase
LVEVLKEEGTDISDYQPRAVFDVFKSGQLFTNVITVYDEASAERCPTFPGVTERLHWSFSDPSVLQGTWEEKFVAIRAIREEIREKIKSDFCPLKCPLRERL